MAEFCDNRGEAGKRRCRGEPQKYDRALIVDGGPLADRRDRRMCRGAIAQHQIKRDANIPTDKNTRRHAPGQRNERQRDHDADGGGNK
jgi:hypothetical protein